MHNQSKQKQTEMTALRRLLYNREKLAWAFYDWADSAFVLCIITVLGPAYFLEVFQQEAQVQGGQRVGPAPALEVGGLLLTGEAAWSFIIALSALVVALSSPFLGALADVGGHKKRILQIFSFSGALATLALWLHLPWWGVGLAILLGNIGFEGATVFYNAFLVEIAPEEERDLLSSLGYALGYLGSVLLLGVILFWFVPPQGDIHLAFVGVGLWWGGFAWLSLRQFHERPGKYPQLPLGVSMGQSWADMRVSLKGLGKHRQTLLYLAAFLLYNDGITTLIANATPFALQNIYLDATLSGHIGLQQLIPAIILVQVVAIPGSMFWGWLAGHIPRKTALLLTLAVFIGVVAYGQVIQVVSEFYVMAGLIGWVLGGAQALSRAMYADFVPQGKTAGFFAFFALSQKFSAMGGPLVYGGLLLATGSTRIALLGLLGFFVAGGLLLMLVNVEQGKTEAL